ncbi:NUDIX hydrolase [Fulvitalea axinellae]|uniref:NUDIX hydrolase n=1 Tax=Fulvitalea axinellae TaxID=1182444 RepID=A0AAU9CQJ6_9BACT|nr:NUDIX hydrolase [Fulvitalea axinellae]
MNISQNIKVAVDAVVFGYEEGQVRILLIKQKFGVYKDRWALPGGFVLDGESLSGAVERELREESGVAVDYMEQLCTFGDDVARDPRAQVISVAYLALVNPSKLRLRASSDAKEAKWFPADNIPELAFDHNTIIAKGLERLKAKVSYQPLGFDLLEKEFPFSDLENLYRAILGRDIDRRNFRKKLMSFGFLEETDKMRKIGSGRPAKLFVFNKQEYRRLESEGIHFEIKYA